MQARRPAAGNKYIPSIYPPFVPVQDHIFKWITPYAILYADQGHKFLSPPAFHHIQQVILASVDHKTRETNATGLLCFTQYAGEFEIPEISRMPASDALLAAFVSSGAAKVSSAQHLVGGLCLWHDVHGAP